MPDSTVVGLIPQEPRELLNRLSRIEGQVKGFKRMVEGDEYCINLINQVRSVNRALEGLAGEITEKDLKFFVRRRH